MPWSWSSPTGPTEPFPPTFATVPVMMPITPVPHIDATISVPGSKSLTQRALIAAALASGESRLHGPLASEDTRYTIAALAAMGLQVDTSDRDCWRVAGAGGRKTVPIQKHLSKQGAKERFTDVRDDVIRFGFGLYQSEEDVERLIHACARLT